MNLYVSGCSFTYGHETADNKHTIKSHRPLWTWGNHLSKHFDGEYVNEAWLGGSNHRIVRRAMTFFNSTQTDNWTAVVQFTDPLSRFEYYHKDSNVYVGMLNDDFMLDDQYYNNVDVPFEVIRGISRKYFSYRHLLMSKKEIVVEYFKQIITLHTYFNSKNIPHLFTFMSGNSCYPEVILNSNISTDLHDKPSTSADAVMLETYNILPRHLFTELPISQMFKEHEQENPPVDRHPNKTGHYKVYLYILNELQKRNYL